MTLKPILPRVSLKKPGDKCLQMFKMGDFKDPIFIDHLNLDRIDGQTLKVRATPEFFVNGKLLVDFSYKGLLNLVESEIYKN